MMNGGGLARGLAITSVSSTTVLTAVGRVLEVGAGLGILFYTVGLLFGLVEIAKLGVVIGVGCVVSSLSVGTVRTVVTDTSTD